MSQSDDFDDVLGEEFVGNKVVAFRTWPSIDGEWLGLSFDHPDGSQTRIALPQESMERLLEEIGHANQLCVDQQRQARH